MQEPTGLSTIEQDSAMIPGRGELILGDLRSQI